MKKIGFSLVFSAMLALVLHAGHPDAAHLLANNHDCGICQVVTTSPSPAVAVHAPSFLISEAISTDFVVVTKNSLALLADLRGPPLSA